MGADAAKITAIDMANEGHARVGQVDQAPAYSWARAGGAASLLGLVLLSLTHVNQGDGARHEHLHKDLREIISPEADPESHGTGTDLVG